jgi:RNA polymerase sigma-70 factor (ECF subfamily)
MAALMQRDPEQFEKFTRDYRPLLLGLARKLSGRSLVEPEDLVQETLTRALQEFDKLAAAGDAACRGWLCTTLTNRFFDLYRQRRTEQAQLPGLRLVQPKAVSPDEDFQEQWASFSTEQFRTAVGRLKPRYREAYELHARGLRYREIAVKLGVPAGTVGFWISEARRELKVLLTEEKQGERV